MSSFSDKTSEAIDSEVSKFLKENHALATRILHENREALDRLAEGLIVWETLDFEQVDKLVKGEEIGVPLVEEVPEVTVEESSKVEDIENDSSEDDEKSNIKNKNGDDPVIAQ